MYGVGMAKLVARLLAAAAICVRIQAFLKNATKRHKQKEWPTHSSAPKSVQKKSLHIRKSY
jgi:hypothetical protein